MKPQVAHPMTPETAWAEAMKFENRANPYPFFDELRKTPVVDVGKGVYVVTGYRELLALAHDPRVSSDISHSPLSAKPAAGAEVPAGAEHMKAYGREPSMIVADPPDHDRARRQAMRHFGPPHTPDLIPGMGADIQLLCDQLLGKAKGKTRLDVVDDYAYPVPVAVICKILGVPLEDEPTFHAWIHDLMAGIDLGPELATEEGKVRFEKAKASTAELTKYLAGLIDGFLRKPGQSMLSKMVNDDGPDGPMSPKEAASNATLLLVAGHDSNLVHGWFYFNPDNYAVLWDQVRFGDYFENLISLGVETGEDDVWTGNPLSIVNATFSFNRKPKGD